MDDDMRVSTAAGMRSDPWDGSLRTFKFNFQVHEYSDVKR
jgi:hypothetical protein